MSQYVIGYGYYFWFAFLWTMLWVFIGMAFLLASWAFKSYPSSKWPNDGRHWLYNVFDSFFFSFDVFLPVISLDKRHESEIFGNDASYRNWTIYYFYIHEIIGYILAFFLVAGLSGLTK